MPRFCLLVRVRRLSLLGIVTIPLILLTSVRSSAREILPQPKWPAHTVAHLEGPADPGELETFLDAFFPEQLEVLHVPGAVFVLVKDGEVFFTKSYGFADLENQTPVAPDKTLFRVASVSKLFTATAIMQLYERGLLKLDVDVNQYLTRFQLADTYPEPVTVANLLTHSGGFDEQYIGMATRSPSGVLPLGQYLAGHMPPRVRPPGEVISYSNHGYALAGYLVEEISGVPFAQYVDENIFQPLGMERSSFELPPALAPDLAVGYKYQNGIYQPLPFDYLNVAPAAGLNTTATDMARFMIAHLQDGRYGDARILSPATAQEMHRQHFTNGSRLPGFTYGFREYFANDQRAIEHSGAWGGFTSQVLLLPDHNLGFFVAYNRLDSRLIRELDRRFLDHYYPIDRANPALSRLPAGPQVEADRFAGTYRPLRYPRRTFYKIGVLFGYAPEIRLTASPGGTLTMRYGRDVRGPTQWMGAEPQLFQQVSYDHNAAFREYVTFRQDGAGRVTHMFAGTGPFEKLAWYETSAFQLRLIAFFVLVFLSAFVFYAPGRSVTGPATDHGPVASGDERLARRLGGLVSGLNLMFLAGLALALSKFDLWELVHGVPPVVVVLLCIPILTTGLAAGLPVCAVLAWKNGYWSTVGRLHYSLIALTALLFIPFLLYWNLLGFHF